MWSKHVLAVYVEVSHKHTIGHAAFECGVRCPHIRSYIGVTCGASMS